ncbi:unnamed protein product [Blepharisma stoltei]|uniref:non-specific serine/threonine protein kinase n=1 Tax=Blepharisma stoltei TaxID=1481888 RepID=A0AAU9IS16_9CILI|nr:unnamed protein product [Blepharisma stoltei]
MYFKLFDERGILKSKSKVEISVVSFKGWSQKSNYPKYAVKKKFLVNATRGKHEVEIMQQVNKLHPWTVKLYDSEFDDNGIYYILMEYCPKGDLRKFIRENKSLNQNPPYDILVRYFLNLADIVMVLHSNNIWHRDIKPDNIFRTEDGELRLGDWGVSKWYTNGDLDFVYHTITGTQPYMSPELESRKKHKRHSVSSPDSDDIWALGQTFYEMCTFERVNYASDIHFSIYSEMDRRNYPESFAELISGMLKPDLLSRWKIRNVWDQLMTIINTINIQPMYKKNDEGGEEEMNLPEDTENNIFESETCSIRKLEFTSIKRIIDIKKEDFQLSVTSYSVASINASIEQTVSSEKTQEILKVPNDRSMAFKTLEIIDENPEIVNGKPGISDKKSEKETMDTYYNPNAEEQVFQNAETGSNLAESIVQTVKIATKIFKDIVPDLPNETVLSFLATLYKENEIKLICPICNADSWVKLSPKNWKPYKIKCKSCRSNFCSFCLYGGSHRKCPDYQNLLTGIWKSTKHPKPKPLKII